MEADEFHAAGREVHGGGAGVGEVQQIERVLEAHQAQADGTVAQVRVPGLGGRIIVDVDDVIEHPHGGAYGRFQQGFVDGPVADVLDEIDGTEVAHGSLLLARVEQDFCAEVR